MVSSELIYINIHGHRSANNIREWVLKNMFAQDYPPDDVDHGNYSVGLHPYHAGRVDEEGALTKVRLATENMNVCAIGEIGLDKSIEAPLDLQMNIFRAQVEIAEFADLPVILHVVRAFNEMIEFMKSCKPVVPMIVHGYHGSEEMAEELIRAGFFLSFGEAIASGSEKLKRSLRAVPVEKLFLETDEGEIDIREVYSITSSVKKISEDRLRMQIYENTKAIFNRFPGGQS
jgi:TatD DNase family protein